MKRLLKPITAAHIFIRNREDKEYYSHDVWEFMERAYKGNFLSFDDETDMKDDSLLWLIVADTDEITDFKSQVYAIGIFKQKFGLKCVAIAKNVYIKNSTDAVTSMIKNYFTSKAWVEVSHSMERLMSKVLSDRYIIPAEEVAKRLNVTEIMPDGQHYKRMLGGGVEVTKVAYGVMR